MTAPESPAAFDKSIGAIDDCYAAQQTPLNGMISDESYFG
jgi:hypothetical protein